MRESENHPEAAGPRAGRSAWTAPRTLTRVAVAAVAVAVFFVAADSIDPHQSTAAPSLPTRPDAATENQDAPDYVKARSLGRYQARDHAIHIVATPEGPRYTITDPLGNILEAKLHEDELRSALEAHGIESGAPADNAATIMMADQPALGDLLD